ncbi:RPII140-upstream gene protein [Armigeres subalbatus]|uniref:RPII140-upstream gene protein n=1 Tax=Armigeres subalbatus TaxID=124917 RepID=UPI002ED3526A
MLRRFAKYTIPSAGFVSAGLFTFSPNDHDSVEHVPMQKMLADAPGDQQTGKDRLYLMFTIDEFGRISNELNSIYQAGFLGFFVGACYGGFIHSRVGYLDFMEKNQATAFKTSFDAKRKLQDQVTVTFARGAFKWGWRLALFTSSYIGIQTIISVYRGKSSIYEYLAAGGITGALYKFSMGPKGMFSGGLVGMTFGGIAGLASLAILKSTGTTMEEVRFWQYKWRASRDDAIHESIRKHSPDEAEPLLELHEEKVGKTNLTLNSITVAEAKESKTANETPAAKTEEVGKK